MTRTTSIEAFARVSSLQYFCALLLLVGVASLPYGYYQFLRLIICLASAFLVYKSIRQKRPLSVAIFVVIALLFNPISPVYLKKDAWRVVDFVTAATFALLGWHSGRKSKNI